MTFSSFIFLGLECSLFGLLVPRKSELEAQTICGQLFITLIPLLLLLLFFFSLVSFNIPKEATFPVSVYIAIICASSSGSMTLKETFGVWDEGEQTFTAGEWEGGVGRRKTFCCLVALETTETIFEDELDSLVFHSLGRKRNKKPDN